MAQLSSEALARSLLAALPGATVVDDKHAPKPVTLNLPALGSARIYLWTATPDRSRQGRPEGEYKSQIIIPSLGRFARQHFEMADMPTFLLGFSPAFGVYILWQVECHQDSAYSKNLQVHENLLQDAASTGWAVAAPRDTKHGKEVRCAVHPAHLEKMLHTAVEADRHGLQGSRRQLFFEAASPDIEVEGVGTAILQDGALTLDEIQNERRRVLQSRLERNTRFSPNVLPLFDFSCAICELQLQIVEAAHIIPVHDSRGVDEPWNGLALCRNHHRLYDRRVMLIDGRAIVRSDAEILDVIEAEGHGNGLDQWVKPYLDRPLAVLPADYRTDPIFQSNMSRALAVNYAMS